MRPAISFIVLFTFGWMPIVDVAARQDSVQLIYDGDIGPDACDFSTISMLHEYHSHGAINLLGVIGETPDPYLASTFSIYNQTYGHDIPIAAFDAQNSEIEFSATTIRKYYEAVKRDTFADQNKTIYEKFANAETLRSGDVYGTVSLYRKLLAEADDDSVVVYTAGQLYNFPPLLASGADRYSDHSGRELLQAKIKEFVLMGGYFPVSRRNQWYIENTNGAEWNWWGFGSKHTTKNTLDAIRNLGKPVTYIGAETGFPVVIGFEMAKRLGREHPTTEAFVQFRNVGALVEGHETDGPVLQRENPAYDELALFYAVEGGVGTYFERVSGTAEIDEDGANVWIPGDGNESYLRLYGNTSQARDETIRKLQRILTDRVTGRF